MIRTLDPDTLTFLITDVARLLRAEFDRRAGEIGLGLTLGEARALVNVMRAGSVKQTALAEMMGVEAMTLSAYIDRLEARNLVRRVPHPEDRRAKLVHLTDEAQGVLKSISDVEAAMRAEFFVSLTTARLEEIQAAFRNIRSVLMELRPRCGCPERF